jgi:HK97 family phage major capsid protein
VIRKLKASTSGDYLWQPSSAGGQPDRLLGYPVAIWEQMDDLDVSGGGNATYPIAFGDFRRAYTIADRHDVRITKDEVTAVGFTKFYVRKRTYGAPMNTNSVKFLKTAA